MAVINRYTQMPAPLVFTPRTMEDLAKVPMAKANRDVATHKAATMIDTTYDVFDEQKSYVEDELAPLKSKIDSITESIANNDVAGQLNEVMNAYKMYQDKLGEGSTIFNMERAKRQSEEYRKQMANRWDVLAPGKAEALIANSYKDYINKWRSGDRGAAFEGNLGVKDSRPQDAHPLLPRQCAGTAAQGGFRNHSVNGHSTRCGLSSQDAQQRQTPQADSP